MRWPRNRATIKLASQRDELLRLRQAGESVGTLIGALRELGIDIGHETLRQWLNRELGRRPVKRKKARITLTESARAAILPASANAEVPCLIPTPAANTNEPTPALPQVSLKIVPVLHTALIRPGETPMEAFRRRKMERAGATQTAQGTQQAKGIVAGVSMPPT
ncbi:MAG: hypothetical protein KA257_02555 [Opitutaceae bacterium]|nr:hypothetical protein [Opitutaceae bacterium]